MNLINSQAFYDKIADKYNWFFSSREKNMERQMDELKPILDKYNVKTILDCSCGDGLQAIGLAKLGYFVDGGDISANMVKNAVKFAEEENVKINFKQSDFRELEKVFIEKYDCVLSYGNSIPHLMTDEDIRKAVCSIYNRTNKIAILEMRNYDDLITAQNKFLPMRINDVKDGFRYSILYVLDYLTDLIRFNIVYLMENLETGEKRMDHESVDYNPIKKVDFLAHLESAGFAKVIVEENQSRICYIAEV